MAKELKIKRSGKNDCVGILGFIVLLYILFCGKEGVMLAMF